MPPEPDIETPDPADVVAPRDTLWLRWAKFLSIIIVAAVLLGGLFSISIHVVALHSAAKKTISGPYSHPIGYSRRDIENSAADTPYAFKKRFLIGAGLGGLIGLGYVIRCLVKDEGP